MVGTEKDTGWKRIMKSFFLITKKPFKLELSSSCKQLVLPNGDPQERVLNWSGPYFT